MKRMTTAWTVSAAILLFFVLLGTLLPGWLGLASPLSWILRIAFWLLGLGASILVLLYLRARAKNLPAAPPDDEVDTAIATARKRLPRGMKLGKAPVVLVIGPTNTAKTTTVQQSGIEPELLAGEVQRAQSVVPTTANVWYAGGVVVVEAGGRLLADTARWGRLLERLQPSRIAAVLARGRQAPRVAIVCMSCEEMVKPGASQSVLTTAQTLRQRLVEAANQFGIRLPVYVLFTKADRLPYFTDYVRSFTREESAEVLGTTLPIAPPVDSGRFKEAESARLADAFGRMLHAVSVRRLDVLPRETAEEVRAGAYEFPRELGKLSGLATQFLVELCRPGQIGTSPFLRGFYFTGVRPLVVSDAAQPAPPPQMAGGSAVDATAVFDPRSMLAAAHHAAVPSQGSRRVPDWTFLPRIFKEIILADRVAMGVTGGGARVNLLRRVLLATAALVFLLLSGAFLVSWLSNRGLMREARAAVATVQQVDVARRGLPLHEDLVRLDSLRTVAARLRGWDTAAPPLRYRWGLYSGNRLLPELRRLYFHRFASLLWVDTRGNLVSYMQALPDTPTVSALYDTAFTALKSYLITTSHPQYSTREYLSPVLLRYWAPPNGVDNERTMLATSQFDYFADELRLAGNPYDAPPDAGMVTDVRGLLGSFGGADRLYQALINQASREVPGIEYYRVVPGAESIVRNTVSIQGAFTKPGWTFVQENVARTDQFFSNDSWVLGDQTVSSAQARTLAGELRTRYVRDYIRVWTDFLAQSSILGYAGVADAARKLENLGGNQSPLLRLFAIVSANTDVDSTQVRPAFEPVHKVVRPGVTDRVVMEENQAYAAALGELGRALSDAAAARGQAETSNALTQADGVARRADDAVTQLTIGVASQGDAAPVGSAVQRLLRQPILPIARMVEAQGAAGPNQVGASFCQDATPVFRKYPFSQNAATEASLEELNRIFQPGGSALSTLVDGLQELIAKQGNEYRARAGVARPPTRAFLDMLNKMQRISDALYPPNAQAPMVAFTLTPQPTEALPEITVNIDGSNHTVTRGNFQSKVFQWRLESAREARVAARVGDGPSAQLIYYPGPWSTFRLFGQARWENVAVGAYRVTWNVNPGGTLSAELRFPGRIPIFSASELGGLSCVSRVVQ
jgi:type VI secretion system protein ImpL